MMPMIWEYITKSVTHGDPTRYDVLREMGGQGWEAWHLQKHEGGFWEIYFKRAITPAPEVAVPELPVCTRYPCACEANKWGGHRPELCGMRPRNQT